MSVRIAIAMVAGRSDRHCRPTSQRPPPIYHDAVMVRAGPPQASLEVTLRVINLLDFVRAELAHRMFVAKGPSLRSWGPVPRPMAS